MFGLGCCAFLQCMFLLKRCLHYDTCTAYMYGVQVYGLHVS